MYELCCPYSDHSTYFNQCLFSYCIALYLACENIPFSSLFAAGEVSLPSGEGYMLLKNDSLLRILRFPGYFETPLFRAFFHFPWDFEIAGFDCIHNFIIILSWVYYKPIQRPAPSWLVSLIGRALHWYRRGQGFESRTSLNFFRLPFCNSKSRDYNCDDLLSYSSMNILANMWLSASQLTTF